MKIIQSYKFGYVIQINLANYFVTKQSLLKLLNGEKQ